MLPRFLLMTLVRKDQDGKSHPSLFMSIMVVIIAAIMLRAEYLAMITK